MPIEITMPQLTDTMTEGTLVKWLKKEGDKVKAGEMIAEVETDKAIMEMESFEGGTLATIVTQPGQKAAVGAPIAVLAGAKDSLDDVKKKYAGAARVAKSAPASQSVGSAGVSKPGGATAVAAAFEGANTAELKEPDEVGHG